MICERIIVERRSRLAKSPEDNQKVDRVINAEPSIAEGKNLSIPMDQLMMLNLSCQMMMEMV